MTLVEILRQLAAGGRSALVLFAIGSLYTVWKGGPESDPYERLKRLAWILMAIAAISYSPAHTAWLIGRPAPKAFTAAADLIASLLACASFIALLAARGYRRGLTARRIKLGALTNLAVLLAMMGAVWLTR